MGKTFNLFILKAPRERLEPKWLVKQRLKSVKTDRCPGIGAQGPGLVTNPPKPTYRPRYVPRADKCPEL